MKRITFLIAFMVIIGSFNGCFISHDGRDGGYRDGGYRQTDGYDREGDHGRDGRHEERRDERR